jgi:hypothetical protein
MADIDIPGRHPHLPDTGDYAYGSIFFSSGGKLLSISTDWTASGPAPSTFDPIAAATALVTPLIIPLQAVFTPTTELLQFRVSFRNDLMQWSGVHSLQGNPGSVSATEPLPDNTNAVLRKLTSHPGPTGRGRIRLPSIPETFVNGNYLTSGGIAAYTALYTIWKTPVTDQTVTYKAAVFSRKDRAFYEIGNMQVDARVYTDRRRTSRI